MPPTCPENCLPCFEIDYCFTLVGATGCGALDCSGSYIVEHLDTCHWEGLGGEDLCDADIDCIDGYWTLEVIGDLGEKCVWKLQATGNGDCPNGIYTLDSDTCGDCDATVTVSAC